MNHNTGWHHDAGRDAGRVEQTYLPDGHSALVLALVAAGTAGQRQEVPVGAVLRDAEGRFLGECGNSTLAVSDPTGHAELRVLRQGAARIGNYRLSATTLTATLEPCAMCYAALSMARVARVVFEAKSPLSGVFSEYLSTKHLDTSFVQREDIYDVKQHVSAPVFVHVAGPEADAGRLLRIFFDGKRKI